MSQNIDWVIHLVTNGVACSDCGKIEENFLPYACNAHTHGMANYDYLDFQIVLNYPTTEICRILNTMGLRVQSGEHFKSGDLVSGIYLDCDVRLDEYEETGRTVLRVVIPDKNGHFPEDPSCNELFQLQKLKTDDLCTKEVN